MAQRIVRVVMAAVVALACILPLAIACGPTFPVATFISEHPDLPLEGYAAGDLGVVLPNYSPSYLVVAYHYFAGRGFNGDEQKQLVDLWNGHLYGYLDTAGKANASGNRTVFAAVPANPYANYPNCLEDAFQTADRTKAAREMQFGAGSAAVQSWSAAQEKVFANCDSSDPKNPTLPDQADASLPPIIRKDRDYQFAAAYFYAGDFDEAKKRFLAIAEDPGSPWKATAAMVIARCDIRSAMLDTDDPVERKQKLAAADEQLKKVLADPALSSVKTGAEQLHGFVAYRLDPDARTIEIANDLEGSSAPEDLLNELDDYNSLMRTHLYGPRAQTVIQQSDMTDWIRSFQARGLTGQQDHRVTRWEQTQSLAWLAAALAYVQPGDAKAAELLAAAAKVPASSPAYLTIAFHRNRLLALGGSQAQAQANIDQILSMPQDRVSASTRNIFLALRMQAARNLDEFLQFAPRQPIGVTTSLDSNDPELCDKLPQQEAGFCGPSNGPLFDSDAAIDLTQELPTRLLVRAAESARLPKDLRLQVAKSAWVRAVLLNQDAEARQLVPTVSSLEPDIALRLKDYNSEASLSARRFAAAFLILHQPEMVPYVYAGISPREANNGAAPGEIDNYRNNWWCTFVPPAPPPGQPQADTVNYGFIFNRMNANLRGGLSALYPDGIGIPPRFMTQIEQQAALSEWKSLTQVGSAPDWLGRVVLDWARAHAADSRVPEALHLVVVSTRYGCGDFNDTEKGDYSKQAFTLLRDRYPKSEWTAETPYWFK